MASSTATGGGSVNNNGGVVVQGGKVSENLTDLSIRANLESKPSYGSKVVQDTASAPYDYTDPHGVTKAKGIGNSSYTLAYTPPKGTNFLLRAAGGDNAGSINGVSSTLLTSPGGAEGQVINKLESTRQIGKYEDTVFNLLALPSSGNFPGLTRGTGAGNAVNYATDNAASPTRSVPGTLVYMFGSTAPQSDNYKAKNSRE